MDYEPIEGTNKRRCRHGNVLGPLDSCPDCAAADTPFKPPTAAELDKEMRLREEEFRTVAKQLRNKAAKMMETAKERGTAIKFYDVALKYERASLEIRNRLSDREHDRWLVEQNRIIQGLSGGGASH